MNTPTGIQRGVASRRLGQMLRNVARELLHDPTFLEASKTALREGCARGEIVFMEHLRRLVDDGTIETRATN